MVIKNIFDSILKRLTDSLDNTKVKITKQDMLDTIDDLESNYTSNIKNDVCTYTKIKSPKVWSLFQYILKPDMSGLEDIKEDNRVYFTIPAGWGENKTTMDIEYYYFTFALNDTVEDMIEFMTKVKIEDSMYYNN